ncbi:hypothetical protein V1264_013036 [Littorina saxatilis]|uniref:CCHC-type domain-containing protein n=1 Tax=Littorina saxatilis TaxID=31220 RepID=A0AAN9AYF0_9CAEN
MESEDDYDALFEKFVKQAETLGLAADKREKYVKESFDRLERKREKDEKQKEREIEGSRRQKEMEREKEREDRQMQKEERQMQKEREEREHQLKQRELEIRQAELSAGSCTPQNVRNSHINVGARPVYPRLPAFREQQDDIDSYLFRFETHAKSLGWEETRWITYLSALLEGNALNLYHSLAAAGELTYQSLKENLLKTFQCTSENVRQKLRYSKPRENEPFQTFGIELRRLFDRWVALSEITTDVDGLRNLILTEQFLESVSADVATFIRERGLVQLDDMVTAAENYRLSRKSGSTIFSAASCVQEDYVGAAFAHGDNHEGVQELPRVGSGFAKRSDNQNEESSGKVTSDAQTYPHEGAYKTRRSRRRRAHGKRVRSPREDDTCFLCWEKGHWCEECPLRINPVNPCWACGLGGHKLKSCPMAKFLEERESGNAVVREVVPPVVPPVKKVVESLKLEHGSVNERECTVLRDTGSTMSGVRRGLVSKDQFVSGNVTCKTFGGEVLTYPQAKVKVETPYVSGEMVCCVLNDPVADLIIGNIPGISGSADCFPDVEGVTASTNRAQERRNPPRKPVILTPDQKVPFLNQDLAVVREELSQLRAELNRLKRGFSLPASGKSRSIETTAAVRHGGNRRKRSRKWFA